MKKLYFLVVLTLLMATSLQAKQVDVNKAKAIAENFLKQQSLTRTASSNLHLAYTATDDNGSTRSAQSTNLFYVFNSGEAEGFVVVAGDDQMRPVLGYSCNGAFDINTANEGLQWWLSAITAKAKAVANGKDKGVYTATRVDGSYVEPIVKTHWSQSSPYNDMCPMDKNMYGDSCHSVTGCVATAMSQLLYTCYAGSVKTLSGVVTCCPTAHAKDTTNVDLSQFTIDYSKMELTYDGDESDEAKKAVATLMYACGLSVNMIYGADASSSNASSYVFKKYFGIDKGCINAHRAQYTSDEWDNLIRSELDNGRAVLYSGQSLSKSGHAFICDGYNSDGLWHINWGWGGLNDGYFDFYSLDFEYTDLQSVVCGIKPGTAEVTATDVLSYAALTATTTSSNKNETKLSCTITNLSCYGSDFDGYVGLALCNSKGVIVKNLSNKHIPFKNNHYGSPTYDDITLSTNDLANGTYELCVVAGTTSDDLHVVKGDGSYSHLTVTVSNSGITVSGSGYQSEETELTLTDYTIGDDGCGYEKTETPVTLIIQNSGKDFLGNIAVDNTLSAKASIKAGEIKQILVNVVPLEAGEKKTFKITAINDYDQSQCAVGEITMDVMADSVKVSNIVIESCTMENTDLAVGDKATIAVKLRNDGAVYKGNVYASYTIESQSGSSKLTATSNSNVMKLSLSKGSSTTLYIDVDYTKWTAMEYSKFKVLDMDIYIVNKQEWMPVDWENADEHIYPTFTVDLENSAVDEVLASEGVKISVNGNSLIVSGTTGSETILIYSVGGALVKRVKAEGSSTRIDGLMGGQSYVVSIKGKNVKVAL